jgi:hypothetical protein
LFFLFNKEDHILQYAALSNEVGLCPLLLILYLNFFLIFENQGSIHWDFPFEITDAVVFFDPERSVNTSPFSS